MSQFVGKWKSNNATRQNFTEYMTKTGIPAELIDKYQNATTYVEYQNDGDDWTMSITTDVSPGTRSYTFQLGKELATKGIDEKELRFVAAINPDGSWTDKSKSELMGWKETTTTRVVNGNKMFVTTTTDDASMSYEMDRQ